MFNSSNISSNASNPQSTTPNDCLALFSAAVSSQPGSNVQRSTLNLLKLSLDQNPVFLPILYPSLLALISSHAHQNLLYRKSVASIIQIALSKSSLPSDQRLQLVLQSTESIHRLITLNDPSDPQLIETKKLAIQAFSSAYPILFKHSCSKSSTTPDSKHWGLSNQIKGTILGLWRSDSSPLGIRLAATKFVQRVIQVGTRGVVDPRKRNEDPSIVMCGTSTGPNQHPYLKPKELEQEACALLEEAVRLLFQSKIPELASAIMVSIGALVRLRPSLSGPILAALVSYNPSASPLASTRALNVCQLKGVEKTLRITLSHLDRTLPSSPQTVQIRDALVAQSKRLDEINERERERKRIRKEDELGAKKRARIAPAEPVNEPQAPSAAAQKGPAMNQLPGFDVTSLPVDLVVELVIANLQVLTDQALDQALTAYLSGLKTDSAQLAPMEVQATSPMAAMHSQAAHAAAPPAQHDGATLGAPGSPVRPKMELVPPSRPPLAAPPDEAKRAPAEEDEQEEGAAEEEELVLEPLADEGEPAGDKLMVLENWHTDAPRGLCEPSRRLMIRMTLDRIVTNGLAESAGGIESGVWGMLLARLVARGMAGSESVEEVEMRREDIRWGLFSFIIADLPHRIHFARVWLMEEWLAKPSEQNRFEPRCGAGEASAYERWLSLLVDYIVEHAPSAAPASAEQPKPSLSSLLVDLPCVPARELVRLEALCQDPDRLALGFTTLRELCSTRPTMRNRTLDVLLGLTTHSRRQTRNAAIMSVKSWVLPSSGMKSLGERVVSFAVQLLQRLEKDEDEECAAGRAGSLKMDEPQPMDVEMEDGETTEVELGDALAGEPGESFARVENAVVVSGLSRVLQENVVVQHLELLLALSVKNPDLLDHLFRAYPNMAGHVQESVNKLITPLVRTLGGKHAKIIALIQGCQAGSEPLVLRMLAILTEKGKAPSAMVGAIKALAASSHALSPRFIIPTIGELSKAEIMDHLPRILTLLDGSSAEKNVVRGVFEAIVQQPPCNFGSVSTNVPRVKQSELLTPVELLVILHHSEESSSAAAVAGRFSIKQAIEAIGICFSMTEIFKPEVLAAFMQQVVDELTLPTLFLRTVIQAVQTYKSLQPFVSTTLLSRLILKKIWTQPQLWEGFMRCAKIIAPHSFGALLQLPRERLKEVVGKQGGLKGPLREYVNKKAGNNKSRVASLLEILGEPSSGPSPGSGPGPTSLGLDVVGGEDGGVVGEEGMDVDSGAGSTAVDFGAPSGGALGGLAPTMDGKMGAGAGREEEAVVMMSEGQPMVVADGDGALIIDSGAVGEGTSAGTKPSGLVLVEESVAVAGGSGGGAVGGSEVVDGSQVVNQDPVENSDRATRNELVAPKDTAATTNETLPAVGPVAHETRAAATSTPAAAASGASESPSATATDQKAEPGLLVSAAFG